MRKLGLVFCFLIVPSVFAGAYYGPTVRDWVWPAAPSVEPFTPAKIDVPPRVDPYKPVRVTIVGPASNAYDVTIEPAGKVEYCRRDDDPLANEQTPDFVAPPGVYTVDMVQVGATGDAAKPFRIYRDKATVTIGDPPPPPPPPPPPVPPKPPTPIPGAGFRVLILEETAAPNRDVVSSTVLRDYLIRKCAKGADGKTPEFRILDDDFTTEQLATMAPNWRDAYLTAKDHCSKDKDGKVVNPQLPWLIVSDGKSGESLPLPATVDETLAVLRKYGGE